MTTIRFDDGAAYERYMGRWSQLMGSEVLSWLRAPLGRRWLDVGCGNGAFTELLMQRVAPASIAGIDPSEAQLAFARTRPLLSRADFRVADAMALPFADDVFDAAIMPLVIFFVPEPLVGVREMARVVAPGGIVAAYSWDMEGRGFPYASLQGVMREFELAVPTPPSDSASRTDVLDGLWKSAGLTDINATSITVHRTFESFADYWEIVQGAPSMGPSLRALSGADASRLQQRLRDVLPIDVDGRITYGARANVIVGRVAAQQQDRPA